VANTGRTQLVGRNVERIRRHCYNQKVPHASGSDVFQSVGKPATISVKRTILAARGE